MTKAEFQRNDYLNELASTLADQPELVLCHNCGDRIQVGMLHRCPWNPEGPKIAFIESPKPDQKPDQPDQSSQLYHLLDYADKEVRHAQQHWRKCKANELFTNPEYYTGRHDSMTIIIGEIMRLINNQSIVDSFTMIDAKQATPGRFYESEKWGRVLCCGTSNQGEWLPAFAIRTEDGRTQMRYLSGEVRESAVQGW